ncbi:MAG TPA: hypothetical protein VKA84_02700 [Gemmatimonadaceae bacterium]|nr:hypothetical protein [Gemmatimonadaceae bacterium]
MGVPQQPASRVEAGEQGRPPPPPPARSAGREPLTARDGLRPLGEVLRAEQLAADGAGEQLTPVPRRAAKQTAEYAGPRYRIDGNGSAAMRCTESGVW